MLTRGRLQGGAVLVAALLVTAALEMAGLPQDLARVSGLVIFAIGFWAFGVLPEALTALTFLLGTVMLAGLPPATVFSGFSTTSFWLIFSGALLSVCATRTGLSKWLSDRLFGRSFDSGSYGLRVALVVLFAAGLALVLPSTLARVAVLVPLVLALCDRLGHVKGSRARTGLVLAAAIGTYIVPTTILPANLPNIILAGSLEGLYGIDLTFGSYMLLHFPVIGLIKGAGLVVILAWLFADRPPVPAEAAAERAPLSPEGKRLGVILAVTLGFWVTDVFHGISPAWVGLTAAVVCLMPAARVAALSDMPFNNIFPLMLYLGSVLAIGAVLTESGAGVVLSAALVDRLPLTAASDFVTLTMLAGLSAAVAVAATMPASPALVAPLFGDIATKAGWTIEAVGMSQVLGYATPLLPYQLPPLMVAVAMTGVPMRDALRVLLLLAVLTTLPMLLVAHLWWGALGWY